MDDEVEYDPSGELIAPAESTSSDTDSAYEYIPPSLTTLKSGVLAFEEENGRSYHALSRGKYVLPNDEQEKERLDLQHHLLLLTLEGNLCLCPKVHGAKRVLDMGTGTGIWAIEYAALHPGAEVIGVDLSPIQPAFIPPNCTFEVDDLEKEWTWVKSFDFIFSRMMLGCFNDLPGIIRDGLRVYLGPGGYFEIQDVGHPPRCDDNSMSPDYGPARWSGLVVQASERIGRPILPLSEYKKYLRDAGFEDVVEVQRKWPTNQWPKEIKYKDLGAWCLANTYTGLEAISLARFTRGLGWTAEQSRSYYAEVRKDLLNKKVHAFWPVYVVYGRKPVGRQPSP